MIWKCCAPHIDTNLALKHGGLVKKNKSVWIETVQLFFVDITNNEYLWNRKGDLIA
jgi:hypothetical protein